MRVAETVPEVVYWGCKVTLLIREAETRHALGVRAIAPLCNPTPPPTGGGIAVVPLGCVMG